MKTYTIIRVDYHSCVVKAKSEEDAIAASDAKPHLWSYDYSDPLQIEQEDNSCQICGADGGTSCGAVNCVY